MKLKIRRTFGFILALITLPLAGYAVAWNANFVQELIASSGGIGWFLGALAVIVVVFLVVFWPGKWPQALRSVLTAIALLAAFLFGGEPVRNAFLQAPWTTIGVVVGVAVWLWVLYGLLVPDKFPVPKFFKKIYIAATNKVKEHNATQAEAKDPNTVDAEVVA